MTNFEWLRSLPIHGSNLDLVREYFAAAKNPEDLVHPPFGLCPATVRCNFTSDYSEHFCPHFGEAKPFDCPTCSMAWLKGERSDWTYSKEIVCYST